MNSFHLMVLVIVLLGLVTGRRARGRYGASRRTYGGSKGDSSDDVGTSPYFVKSGGPYDKASPYEKAGPYDKAKPDDKAGSDDKASPYGGPYDDTGRPAGYNTRVPNPYGNPYTDDKCSDFDTTADDIPFLWGGDFDEYDKEWYSYIVSAAANANVPIEIRDYIGKTKDYKKECENSIDDSNHWKPLDPTVNQCPNIPCPYNVTYMTWFKWPGSTYGDICYIMAPCFAKVKVVTCNSEFCNVRDRKYSRSTNRCVQVSPETFTTWVYCPTFGSAPGICKTKPWECSLEVDIIVPQLCECWTCDSSRYGG